LGRLLKFRLAVSGYLLQVSLHFSDLFDKRLTLREEDSAESLEMLRVDDRPFPHDSYPFFKPSVSLTTLPGECQQIRGPCLGPLGPI
jgi:hypothetical protein